MRKILLLSFALVLILMQQVYAQNKAVSGKVTDQSTGQGLPGVSVVVKGTSVGTATSADGTYTISVPAEGRTLVFRFIGYKTIEQAIGSSASMNVTMGIDQQQLSEVVVTGYTTQTQREVVGSISTVKADEIKQTPIASFDQALQGRAPGILVQANSGQPGAAANIVIRGKGSIMGNNSPLYIMDGVEISAADFATINPADFESMTVLKDASATSIYGSRGANGVVVITTRKGLAGKTRINYDVQYGFSNAPENKLELMNTEQKLQYELQRGNPYDWTDEDLARLRKVDTNWEDVFFETGTTKNHTLSASGGSEKTTYYLSGSMFDQTGTVPNTGLERYTGRANVESNAGNFNFGLNSTFGYSEFTNTSEANSGIAAPLNAIRWTNPYETPYDEAGNYTQMASGQPNALQELLENKNLRQQLKGVGNIYVGYEAPFLKGLSFRTTWGGDFTSNETSVYVSPDTYSGQFSTGGSGSYGRGYNRAFRYTGTTSASYSTAFGGEHTLSVALYNEIVNRKYSGLSFTGYGLGGAFQNEAGITPGNATNGYIPAVGGGGTENALLSYFTNINYGFRDRYYLTIGARRDGSSRFGADRRFANFGSVGLSWIVSDEPFMEGLTDVFNDVKFKVSYGSAGNQALEDDFASRELFGRSVYNGVSGLAQRQLANPLLQWERKTTFNTGVEFSTLNGRLAATVEYYNAITSDLFLDRQLSRTTGYPALLSNVGKLQNRGVELALNGDIVASPNFTWSANVSLTYNKNEVKELVGGEEEIVDGLYINRVGEPMNSLYVVRYAGVNPQNGNPQYLTKDGEITETYSPNDRVIVGTVETPFFGGFGTSLNFKGLEVSTFFSFVTGNKLFNNDRANVENPQYLWDNLSLAMLDEWQKEGDITDVPRPRAPFRSGTTRFVENGDFLRLRNINVSYALPQALVNSLGGLRSVRVFAQGQNLATWTEFQGFDPEVTDGSLVGAQYPALRTLTFGLNVGF
ncbi:TonB-linked SusC/RagA family outer membrane protein [Pontibacter ummariensis]|uniref:TonB-linked outer membrane protein, SusC/RagA family n=1 Tax=Pontibacter ummariensis TaxID=1610492 RepID=A0A239KI03_9BACT|nr:TonB-dependent receptor [Pontibacter ummariensis]PRY05736.1 TonB-linked SusC/RagA family outer membrane protein [Pontibacter ummariensis]SNT17705.1 TonB-linked outer membrane protein, SusC/RagA family [Pontibacter ummariensis]